MAMLSIEKYKYLSSKQLRVTWLPNSTTVGGDGGTKNIRKKLV